MTLPATKPATRRRYPREFKQQIVDLCQPGISIAGIATAHGLNVNMVRRWIHQRQAMPLVQSTLPANPMKLVPLSVQHPAVSSDSMIEIHVERKGTTVRLRWPSSATASLTVLLSNWLK